MEKTIIANSTEIIGGENLKNFTGVAYSGNVISQPWGRTVIALEGLDIAPQIPLLYNHYNEPIHRLGVCEVTVVDSQILVAGKIDMAMRHGKELINAGQEIPWQMSIGAAGKQGYELQEGETAIVNGNEITGPCVVFTKAILREISVVAVGADPETEMHIAAAFNINQEEKEPEMEEEKIQANEEPTQPEPETQPEPTQPEPEPQYISCNLQDDRQTKFKALIQANENADTQIKNYLLKAVCSDTTVEEATAYIRAYNDIQAAAVAVPNIIVKKEKEMDNKTISAALMQTIGVGENQIAAAFGEQTLQAAQGYKGMTLKDAAIHAAQLEGKSLIGYNGDNLVKAAFSTISLPGILESVIHASLLRGFDQVDSVWKRFCSTTSLPDLKRTNYYRIDGFNRLKPVLHGGVIKSMSVNETSAHNQIATVGGNFSITREDIINDNLQALSDIPRKFGVAAAREVDIAVAKLLEDNPVMDDAQKLFSTKHKNTVASGTALTEATLTEARTKFLRQTDSQGNIIYARPRYLVVPPELEATAVNITQSLEITGASAEKGKLNVASRYGLDVIVNPYLTSTTGWYLLAGAEELNVIEVAFLNGVQTPLISGPYTNIDTDGFGWKATFDYGVAPITFQGGFYNPGA